MAILQGGIMQGFSGKVGKIVGARVNGQDTIRSYQPIVNNPKSLNQEINRKILKAATQFVATNVDRAYRDYAFRGYSKTTGFGSFVAACILLMRDKLSINNKTLVEGMISRGISPRYDIINGTKFTEQTLGAIKIELGGKTGTAYFGSDVLLDNSQLCMLYTRSVDVDDEFSNLGRIPVFKKLGIGTTTPFQSETTEPKKIGLFANNAECGGWKYIYEIGTEDVLLASDAPKPGSSVIFAFVGQNSMTSMYFDRIDIIV